ncbi:MAG: RNase adapter RapZ [Anaerovoracaceae bacterium]|jgi:UPF0042 nucleotide-binding protein
MSSKEKLKVVIISGLSGAGKTHAADWLEDKGYYCVDNMPPELIRNFIELTAMNSAGINKAAFVVDIRSRDFYDGLVGALKYLADSPEVDYRILYMEASDQVLVKRYNETRRNHPLSQGPVTMEVVEEERTELEFIRRRADFVIDTTNMKVSQMNLEMEKYFGGAKPGKDSFVINVVAFGYKYGLPLESDVIFDVRFLPNPFYVPELKELTGNDEPVRDYVMKYKVAKDFIAEFRRMFEFLIPYYRKEGKYHLNVAFGCTGGQHRSVVLANEAARALKEDGCQVTLRHRDLQP